MDHSHMFCDVDGVFAHHIKKFPILCKILSQQHCPILSWTTSFRFKVFDMNVHCYLVEQLLCFRVDYTMMRNKYLETPKFCSTTPQVMQR